jgi:hypothetical protein
MAFPGLEFDMREHFEFWHYLPSFVVLLRS